MADNTTSTTSLSRVLPEQLMLGLRLTVGEDQVAKPHPPSRLGRGNFPEREGGEAASQDNQYYPAIATLGMSSILNELYFKHFSFQTSETPATSAVPSRPS